MSKVYYHIEVFDVATNKVLERVTVSSWYRAVQEHTRMESLHPSKDVRIRSEENL